MPLIIPKGIVDQHVERGLPRLNYKVDPLSLDSDESRMRPPPVLSITKKEMLESASLVKSEIADILKLDSLDGWEVIDARPDEGLYMISPDDCHMQELGEIIGIVVDLSNKTVISGSFGFVENVVTTQLEGEENGDLVLTDIFGGRHQLSSDEFTIKPYIEGIELRIFYHNGHMYVSTSTKLHVDKSKIPSSVTNTFLEMYESLGGPSANELFDTTKKYSPNIYHFTISTPDTRYCSKIPTNGIGFLVYESQTQWYTKESSPYPEKETDFVVWNGTRTDTNFKRVISHPGLIYKSDNIEIDIANIFLQNGFSGPNNVNVQDDERLGLGEVVMMTVVPKNREEHPNPYQIKIKSPDYNWRFNYLGENRNLVHQFYALAGLKSIDTTTEEGLEEFIKSVPLLPFVSIAEIIDHIESVGPIYYWPNSDQPNPKTLSTEEGRLYNIWAAMIMAVPFELQIKIAPLLRDFYQNRSDVIEWIQDLEESYEDMNDLQLATRVKTIIRDARRLARGGTFGSRNVHEQVRANIETFIRREYTDSLYRLIKEMNRWKKSQIEEDSE